jgi:uncharacterized MnhB-related membrane protein
MILESLAIFEYMLLIFLIGCSLAVSITRKVITAVIIFMSYSIVMSIVWILLEAPDLALTEAAIGAGITSVLFFLAIKRINMMDRRRERERGEQEWQNKTQTKNGEKISRKTGREDS